MPVVAETERLVAHLRHRAAKLRILSIRATTEAGSGHPTSCASAADLVAALFFRVMRRHDDGTFLDRFILSKGHAAPLLYAAWAESGAMPEERLLGLRKIDSDLEGHPTPRLPFVDVATGSLGQGLSAGIGLALDAQYVSKSSDRTYVLLGDGECAEGSVWEAAASASDNALSNLCAIVDINRLGQSGPTQLEHDVEAHARRWSAFGWNAIPIDGHDFEAILRAFDLAANETGRPSVILARTRKGEGLPDWAGKEGHHGKALSAEEAKAAIASLQHELQDPPPASMTPARFPRHHASRNGRGSIVLGDAPYSPGKKAVATRKAFGQALEALGKASRDVVVLDADVKNSTYTEMFGDDSKRFFEMYIAEQNMVGAAMGLAAAGRIPFAATFACFLSRAYDFVRMAAISGTNIKLAGTHAGVSIGEDGPSQMGLEDLAMFCAQPNFTVLYPSDAVSTWRAVEIAAQLNGPVYLRLSRPETPVLYRSTEAFSSGTSKILRQDPEDRVTIVGAGVTLFEALQAHDILAQNGIRTRVIDLFSVQPLDSLQLLESIAATGGRLVTVEDHYHRGGLGEAICALAANAGIPLHARNLAVGEIPRSGAAEQLLQKYAISHSDIVAAVQSLL